MTWGGGQPHRVGDTRQRFEISFFDPEAKRRRVLGWTNRLGGAYDMAKAVRLHPSWTDPEIWDRNTGARVTEAPP